MELQGRNPEGDAVDASNERVPGHEPRKIRVTTFIDRDVVMWLKVRALEERVGYQTLLNRFLRLAAEDDGERGTRAAVGRGEFEKLASEVTKLSRTLRRLKRGTAPAKSRTRSISSAKAGSRSSAGAKSATGQGPARKSVRKPGKPGQPGALQK